MDANAEPLVNVAKVVAKVLNDVGFEAYVVGGSVRDLLMGRKPKDLDIATDAMPEKVIEIFTAKGFNVVPTGLKHGTVTLVYAPGLHVEITTFRSDGLYSDGRHPDDVKLGVSLSEDLGRRDFTMNAIALDPVNSIYADPFGGTKDITSHRIRAVGNPAVRFIEDGLRPMRAVRFYATLGFVIDPDTELAIGVPEVLKTFSKVSAERVRDELMKGLASGRPDSFVMKLNTTGLLDLIIPEFKAAKVTFHSNNGFHYGESVWKHSVSVLSEMSILSTDPILRLVALLHDIGKPATETAAEGRFVGHEYVGADMTEEILRRLKFTAEEIDRAKHLVKHHMRVLTAKISDHSIRRLINVVGPEHVNDMLKVRLADLYGMGTKTSIAEAHETYKLIARVNEILNAKPAFGVRDLKVKGTDIMALGVPAGPKVGAVLNKLLEKVLEDPGLNDKDKLIALAKEHA